MEILYNKYKNKLVRLSESVVGVIIGYSSSHLIMLLEDGVNVDYSFTLDDIGDEDPYVDFDAISNCEECNLSWVDENQILKKW
jgi:hypothetical protein